MVNEVWRPVPGREGYEVSDHGNVRSYRNRQGHPQPTPRLMAPAVSKGYRWVKFGRSAQIRIHVLVLETFVGPRPEGMVCRHLDGNPLNNHVGNLRWGTLEENYADRRLHGTHNTGSRHGRATINEDDVRVIKGRLAAGETHRVIAADFGVKRGVVSCISAGRSWTHVGENESEGA